MGIFDKLRKMRAGKSKPVAKAKNKSLRHLSVDRKIGPDFEMVIGEKPAPKKQRPFPPPKDKREASARVDATTNAWFAAKEEIVVVALQNGKVEDLLKARFHLLGCKSCLDLAKSEYEAFHAASTKGVKHR